MTASDENIISVEMREETGKGVAGRLRRAGRVPAVLYGGDKPSVSISVEEEVVRNLLRQAGDNAIFLLKLKGGKEERKAMIRDLQVDPISGGYVHIDFIRVTRGHHLHVNVAVELVGNCIGVKEGGRLDFSTRELAVEVLPSEMFSKIEIDISDLAVGQHLEVKDLQDKLPPSAKFLEDPHRLVVMVEEPRAAAAEEEAVPAVPVAAEGAAEPELIRKTKEGGEK